MEMKTFSCRFGEFASVRLCFRLSWRAGEATHIWPLGTRWCPTWRRRRSWMGSGTPSLLIYAKDARYWVYPLRMKIAHTNQQTQTRVIECVLYIHYSFPSQLQDHLGMAMVALSCCERTYGFYTFTVDIMHIRNVKVQRLGAHVTSSFKGECWRKTYVKVSSVVKRVHL